MIRCTIGSRWFLVIYKDFIMECQGPWGWSKKTLIKIDLGFVRANLVAL